MRLLITRPEPDATRSAQALHERGYDVLLAPLMHMQAIDADLGDGPFAGVLITSANAARAAQAHSRFGELKRLPVFAVGNRSAEAAREAGFENVSSAAGALADLVGLVLARFAGSDARVVYFAGEDRAGDLAAGLATRGIAVHTAVVYRAVARNTLPDDAAQALASGGLDGAVHYSRRSAATLLRLAGQAGALNAVLGLTHCCLSDEVASPLRDAGAGRILVAPHPDEAALIALISP